MKIERFDCKACGMTFPEEEVVEGCPFCYSLRIIQSDIEIPEFCSKVAGSCLYKKVYFERGGDCNKCTFDEV